MQDQGLSNNTDNQSIEAPGGNTPPNGTLFAASLSGGGHSWSPWEPVPPLSLQTHAKADLRCPGGGEGPTPGPAEG